MAGRGRSPARAALSRLPGWVTVLGVFLVLGELTGGAALLAAGPHPAHGPHPARGAHGGTGATAAMHTVVLRVDTPDTGCNPAGSCGAYVQWQTPAGSGAVSARSMPFIKTVRVPAGGKVAVEATPNGDKASCSITLDRTELSRVTTTENGHAQCDSVIPAIMVMGRNGGTRPVVLQVGENLGDTVTYTTPGADGRVVLSPLAPSLTDDGNTVEPAINFTKTVDVREGGIVTIHAFSPTGDAVVSTITVDGAVVSSVKSGHSSDSWVKIP